MEPHKVVSRDEWLLARKAHLAHEKEFTRSRDRLSAERRALPWVKIDKTYAFDGPEGKQTLADLFERRSQLIIYHFMLTPGSDHVCEGCCFISDHVDAARMHFEHNDVSFAAISRAPLSQIEPVKKRMGWQFKWLSSYGTDFNCDFHVTIDDAVAPAEYNYTSKAEHLEKGEPWFAQGEQPGLSVFYTDTAGNVFHTYSTYARGGDLLIGAYNYLDLTPKGRNETTIMDWVRRHDEYEASGSAAACCHTAKHS